MTCLEKQMDHMVSLLKNTYLLLFDDLNLLSLDFFGFLGHCEKVEIKL